MHSIWAVAINTIRQALRMKVALVFIILLVVLIPVLGYTTTGDETLKGRLQTFVSYSLSLTSFSLCLLTIIISIYSVTSDIDQRQIYTVITKPIHRYQLLLGKFLGVLLLDMVLLVLFSVMIYTITIYTPVFLKASGEELLQTKNEFLTARAALTIPKIDVSEQVMQRYEMLEKRGELPEGMTRKEIIDELTRQSQIAMHSADVGKILTWDFENVRPLDPNMFIRFKYDVSVTPPDEQVYGRWFAGDYNFIKTGEKPQTPIYDQLHKNAVRTFHEIVFPSDVVPPDGHLAVAFYNVPLNNTVVIFPPDGFEVLYKADSFANNYVRAVLLLFFRLIFLASLGILASSFLSFPVAILLSFVLFFTASFSGFVIESFDYLSANMGLFYTYTLKWMIRLLPQFDRFNPAQYIVPAKLLGWSVLVNCIVVMICIKAFLLFVAAMIIFSFREIAKIVV